MHKKSTPQPTYPYNVTMREVERSSEWLQEEYRRDDETFHRSDRSEVRECRFPLHCSDGTKDADILEKYQALLHRE